MARNGSGTYNLPPGNPVSPGTTIEASWANETLSDIGTALTGSLPRDGQAPMTGILKITDGSEAAPAIAFNSEASTGLFRAAAGILGLSVSGTEKLRIKSTGSVLIGTTTDTGEKLQVNGTAKIAGAVALASTLAVSGASTLAGLSATTGAFSSTLNVTGSSTFAALSATSGSFSSTLGVTGATTLAALSATTGSFSSTLGVSGATTLAGLSATTGSFSSTLAVTGAATFSNTISTTSTLTASTGVNTGGNVSLTGTGDQRLQITGTTDGSDTGRLILASTGGILQSRGAYLILAGNETATAPGSVTITSGETGGITLNSAGSVSVTATGGLSVTNAAALGGTLAVTGATTLSSTLTVNGATTFNAIPILQTAAGSAQLEFRENDQTLPAGRWRFTADADSFQLRHNTAAGGDFSTYATPISVNASNNTTITGSLAVSSTVTATGGFSGALTGNASTATALQTARTINGVSFDGTANITIPATAPNSLTPGAYLTGSAYDGSAARTFAVDATSSNTASKVVARDSNGDFAASNVTLSGDLLMSNTTADIYHTLSTARIVVSGGSSNALGANAIFYGESHATTPNRVTFRAGATTLGYVESTGFTLSTGVFTGNGSGLTTLNADELGSGTVPSARLSGSYGISITGNAATATNASTATALQTARTINGVSFNGTANITVADSTKLPLAGGALTGDVTSTGTLRFDSSAFGTIGMRTGAAVGVSPNTSADDLVIESSTGNAGISILNNSAYYGGIFFGDEASATVAQLRYTHSTNAFTFYTAGTLSMTISSAGLVTAVGGFSGDLTGNASTATTLQTARTINGVSFNGSANITVTAAAGTLTGTTLNSTVVTSSLTSVGTLGSLTVSGTAAVGLDSTVGGIEIGYRNIPRLTSTTLAATSNGKVHAVTAGVTVPASTFAAGDTVAIYNNSAAAITLTQGSGLTLRWAGTSSTGNRTLAAYGWASIWFNSATEAVASGNLT